MRSVSVAELGSRAVKSCSMLGGGAGQRPPCNLLTSIVRLRAPVPLTLAPSTAFYKVMRGLAAPTA